MFKCSIGNHYKCYFLHLLILHLKKELKSQHIRVVISMTVYIIMMKSFWLHKFPRLFLTIRPYRPSPFCGSSELHQMSAQSWYM